MAKITGLSGMIQGKVGPTVYRVSRGVQIASQYNPNPSNPRSPAQIDRRSIFSSSVRLAKSVYDDAFIGPLFKSKQYKQRTQLIGLILSSGRFIHYVPDEPSITTKSSLVHNWIPGFENIPIVGDASDTELTVSISPEADGAQPSIAGAIVVCTTGPTPDLSIDDLLVFGFPDHVVSQGVLKWASSVIVPGSSANLVFPLADFAYGSSTGGSYVMPTASQGRAGFSALMNADRWKCWYVIPLSYDYDGFGLRTVIDGVAVTVGKMQLLYKKPGA